MAEQTPSGNIKNEYNSATTGLNLDQTLNQTPKGKLTYALNAVVENFDGNSVNYQNEPGAEFCFTLPADFVLIGDHYIQERSKHIFFVTNPVTGESQIGYMDNNDCQYHILVQGACLNFNSRFPIHKVVHRITNCTVEIYWTDGFNPRRYLDINNIPYILSYSSDFCDPVYTDELDCNQLKLQPNFKIPELEVVDIITGGDNLAGTYQFAVQYSDASGNPFTSFYSITNPTPLSNTTITTPNFNYEVGKSIVVRVDNLDDTGQFQYFNLAVIKTINNISTPELVGTYFIDVLTKEITYTGQSATNIQLSINDIFEKYPYYDIADDVTAVQDILVWKGLTTVDRINYQQIASQIQLLWETYKIPNNENYANELNATNLRGYLRDEIYAFEVVFLLRNGKQTDAFHIPGRMYNTYDASFPDIPETDPDFIGEPTYYDSVTGVGYSPWWKIYNTGRVLGSSASPNIANATAHEYGDFAYWESTETYPCNEDVWGELAGQPIRHHKFPDVLVSPIFESGPIVYNPDGEFAPVMQNDSVFPIGVKINPQAIAQLINSSNLTSQQKSDIVGFKIVRGDRGTNKSIVAKGLIRNVNEYEREQQTYYFPNYPYNDLGQDPFINSRNNAYSDLAEPWLVICEESGTYEFTDPNTNKPITADMVVGSIYEFCSITRPIYKTGKANIGPANYDAWVVRSSGCRGFHATWTDPFSNENLSFTNRSTWLAGWSSGDLTGERVYTRVEVGGQPGNDCDNPTTRVCKCNSNTGILVSITQPLGVIDTGDNGTMNQPNVGRRSSLNCKEEQPLQLISENPELKYRQVLNSPETSFGQPFLGDVLKMESVIFGGGKAHFVEVKDNAKYKLLSKEAQQDALDSASHIGSITNPFNAVAMFTAYQSYLTIYINGITRKNYAYSFNSIADYNYSLGVPNGLGVKQRELDLKQYLIPGVQSVGDDNNVNNYQRESSVYLRTDLSVSSLPFPSDSPNLIGTNIVEHSRIAIGESNACATPGREQDITVVSYYGSLKNIFEGQWGQIYSYETVDTGFQQMFVINAIPTTATLFGGDTFISRFAFKTKVPFFIDNRVGAPDDSDIFYDEIGNIGYPKYWHSARSILENYTLTEGSSSGTVLTNFISYKAHHFDCPNDPSSIPSAGGAGAYGSNRTFYDGYFYLFAYGIPNFYCESSYNTDLRQAFNNREGDFWPHVSTGIPDDWVQENFVSIANDNTYTYNVTYSKQNKENTFTHLPPDWQDQLCFTHYPFRAIYSEPQVINSDVRVNNWLIYRPLSLFDFPQNYGDLISLDGIQNKAILARFENKSLMYNNLLTMDTSNPQAAYLGNPRLFEGAPPIDFAETDLGYVGSQNKFLLKIPEGQITIDAKRGQIFLISGTNAIDLTGFNSGVTNFMSNHLPFEILNYFPSVPTDNHFNGIGLHGVYDARYNRILITKLDFIPVDNTVKYDDVLNEFYVEQIIDGVSFRTQIYLSDVDYFCNKSWTMSFNFNTKSWISYHSYLPNWYIGDNNFFYSGLNGCCSILDADFGLIVGTLDKMRITTTSTTTAFYVPSTTSTTTLALDCELEGEIIETDCVLEGEAIITVPPSTTTTICQRPNLPMFYLYSGYQIGIDPPVVSTGSLEEVCNAISVTSVLVPFITLTGFSVNSSSLSLEEFVYYDADSTDCTYVPDGWYFTNEGMFNGFAYYIEGGIITAIESCMCGTTTTTTTLVPVITECCGILFSSEDEIHYMNPQGNITILNIPLYVQQMGIAMTYNKFWTIGTTIEEWDITLSPFLAMYNRSIAFPGGFVIGPNSGMGAKNDNTIYAVDNTTPQEIVEMDITGVTGSISSVITTLPADREVRTNLLYAGGNKLIFGVADTTGSDYYVIQVDIPTGTIDVNINVGPIVLTSVFSCDCNIYFVDDNNSLYVVNRISPYSLELVDNSFPIQNVLSAAQISNCVTNSITNNSNFTTTTTSTTVIEDTYCYTVQVTGTCLVTWLNASGETQSQEVTDDVIDVCARFNSVDASCDDGTIIITGGITTCVTAGDCITTTTTTTL